MKFMTKKLFNYIRIKKLIVRSTNLFAILANYTASGLGRWAVLKEFFMRLRLQSFTYRGYILTVCGGPRVVQQDRHGSVSTVLRLRGLVAAVVRGLVGAGWISSSSVSSSSVPSISSSVPSISSSVPSISSSVPSISSSVPSISSSVPSISSSVSSSSVSSSSVSSSSVSSSSVSSAPSISSSISSVSSSSVPSISSSISSVSSSSVPSISSSVSSSSVSSSSVSLSSISSSSPHLFYLSSPIPDFSNLSYIDYRGGFFLQPRAWRILTGGGYKRSLAHQAEGGKAQKVEEWYFTRAEEQLSDTIILRAEQEVERLMRIRGRPTEAEFEAWVFECFQRASARAEMLGLGRYYRTVRVRDVQAALAQAQTPAVVSQLPPSQAVAAGGSNNSGGFLRMVVEVLLRKGPFLCGTVALVGGLLYVLMRSDGRS